MLATRGTRTNRPMARKSARGGLMVRVYDRALLRSSGRIHGDPVEPKLDRFAMAVTGTRMRASGLHTYQFRGKGLSDRFCLAALTLASSDA